MWPDLGGIEDIDVVRFRFLRCHDLYAECPGWEVASLDCIPHIFGMVVRFLSGKLLRLGDGHRLDTLVGMKVEFDIDKRAILFVSLAGKTGLSDSPLW
jgi:hypothetical protein